MARKSNHSLESDFKRMWSQMNTMRRKYYDPLLEKNQINYTFPKSVIEAAEGKRPITQKLYNQLRSRYSILQQIYRQLKIQELKEKRHRPPKQPSEKPHGGGHLSLDFDYWRTTHSMITDKLEYWHKAKKKKDGFQNEYASQYIAYYTKLGQILVSVKPNDYNKRVASKWGDVADLLDPPPAVSDNLDVQGLSSRFYTLATGDKHVPEKFTQQVGEEYNEVYDI